MRKNSIAVSAALFAAALAPISVASAQPSTPPWPAVQASLPFNPEPPPDPPSPRSSPVMDPHDDAIQWDVDELDSTTFGGSPPSGDRDRNEGTPDASSPAAILDEFTRQQRVASQGGHHCRTNAAGEQVCQASRTSCSAAHDYTMNANGDIYATPNANRSPASDQVTLESVTV